MTALTQEQKQKLSAEFERPKVVERSPEEIRSEKEIYIQVVASCALEGHAPDDFGKVATMERIRGELTPEKELQIYLHQDPVETERIQAKVARLQELGLSWKDL